MSIIRKVKNVMIIGEKKEGVKIKIVKNIVDTYWDIMEEEIEKMEWIDRVGLYKKKNCNDNIVRLLEQNKNSKKFGVFMENITKRTFGFNKSFNSEHDFIFKGLEDYKIELKSSCLLLKDLENDKHTFQYNSIRMNYDYQYLMVCNLNLNDLEYYIVDKETFKKHIDSLNIKQKKLKSGILELITFKRIKAVMKRVYPEDFETIFYQL